MGDEEPRRHALLFGHRKLSFGHAAALALGNERRKLRILRAQCSASGCSGATAQNVTPMMGRRAS